MNTDKALYDPMDVSLQGDTREFEKAILQTAIIYRIAQYRAEQKRADGRSLEVMHSEDQSAIYKAMLFALIDEWLAGNRETPSEMRNKAHSFDWHERDLQEARAAVHN